MHQKGQISVLVSPLDWGLGHATRCIPIINEIIQQGAEVMIACTGSQKLVFNQVFPGIECLEIPGYQIRYKSGVFLKWKLVLGIPGILKQIRRENRWLNNLLQTRKVDIVISDNRYGLYNKKLHCIFITHQLSVRAGRAIFTDGLLLSVGNWLDRKIQHWNYRYISKFSVCWVPDFTGVFSLAGELSNPKEIPDIPLVYIGILSRFHSIERMSIKHSLLILLSGPEPARSQLENILFKQLIKFNLQAVVIRGIPDDNIPLPFIHEGIKIYNHLPPDQLQLLLCETDVIIARSGYSTIMDLLTLKRNAILIPTPGQTEQEYLGKRMHEKKWMFTVSQDKFNLKKAIFDYRQSEMIVPELPENLFSSAVQQVIKMVDL